MQRERGNVHKSIGYAHRTYNHHVHEQRDDYHPLVETYKAIVLLQAIFDEVGADDADEVEI